MVSGHEHITKDPQRARGRGHVERHESRDALLRSAFPTPRDPAADLQDVLLGGQHEFPAFDRDGDVGKRRKSVAVDDRLRRRSHARDRAHRVAGGAQLPDHLVGGGVVREGEPGDSQGDAAELAVGVVAQGAEGG